MIQNDATAKTTRDRRLVDTSLLEDMENKRLNGLAWINPGQWIQPPELQFTC